MGKLKHKKWKPNICLVGSEITEKVNRYKSDDIRNEVRSRLESLVYRVNCDLAEIVAEVNRPKLSDRMRTLTINVKSFRKTLQAGGRNGAEGTE